MVNPLGQLAAIHRPEKRPDRGQRRCLGLAHMNSGANPHPRWRRRHHRISDPTQPRTLNHTQILPATTDNPAPPVAGLTPARYRSLPLTTRPAAANPVPAALGFAQEYGVPLLIVLCDNEQYASQTWNVLKYYPNSDAVATTTSSATSSRPRPTT